MKPNTTNAQLFAAKALESQVRNELTDNILPFWTSRMIRPDGALYGRIDGSGKLDTSAPIGAIMTARVLWTYSSAARVLEDEKYLETAKAMYKLIAEQFVDKKYGGIYWALTPSFKPLDTKKQIYAIAFAIYGLAEYYRACGDEDALELAKSLFYSIEQHSFDNQKNGYFEAFTRDWAEIGDMRLSDKDANECKTMNTHLHVLEAYTLLYRVWKDDTLHTQLRGLIKIFTDTIVGADGHLRLFFDDDWNCAYDIQSYGHDIEASWLLYEAAEVLGDEDVIEEVKGLVPKIVSAASEGFDPKGGMIYEHTPSLSETDCDRHWWVQAESVVGYFNLWQLSSESEYLENALMCWDFIKEHLIDKEGGEWFWSIRKDGSVNRDDDKAGFWKCPYHNGRMCMEIIERYKTL